MTHVDTPQTRCRASFGRADITPPAGIYHRMWGAALHERATGVHRPLTATALLMEAERGGGRRLVLGLDHCLLEAGETATIRGLAGEAAGLSPDEIHVALSHTHGSAWLSRSRAHLPGGDLIGPYLDRVAEVCAGLARDAAKTLRPATVLYGTARCSLAAHRDFWDAGTKQIVCGFNPAGPADDTVLVAKVVADTGKTLGTVVNYACHPTTLAWENTLVSPDYVGAMREVVERETGAPCLFLQGSSGELGPREGYVGDTAVADRNGRQLGFAALSGLEALPSPGTYFEYAGPVVSGATLGTWKHRPVGDADRTRHATWQSRQLTVGLPYRVDLPTMDETQADLARWEATEAAARAANDAGRVRDAHAHVERMNRQITRLAALPPGKAYPFPVAVWRLGDSLWVFTAGEQYQALQTTLRKRFPDVAVVVSTITDDWQPGYLPAASSYGYGIYQEVIAAVGPGCLETLIEAVTRECRTLLNGSGS
ncbi:MAG: Neutral/alkaline non-lysosomal ceramidase [Gemmataceae bacterium]|nr:Neutral/alkaline non-lysosomal ceramidase [Gemmataceae bacterium]